MLPLGSVVYLEKGMKKIMITSIMPVTEQNGEQVYFDYDGCFFPEGYNPEQNICFHEENIEKVIHEGFLNDDAQRQMERFQEWKQENDVTIKRGEVIQP